MLADRIRNRAVRSLSGPLEAAFRLSERGQMSRGAVLDHIPRHGWRGGGLGTTTYGEWCYTIGIFQTLIFVNMPERPVRMLDVGCGVGRMYLSAKPYLTSDDSYLGIDVMSSVIEICKKQYKEPNVQFLHVDADNGYYSKEASSELRPWALADAGYNLITALSVWTHLREDHWLFYLAEIGRVLSPGGRAIISFFVKDEMYEKSLRIKGPAVSKFYPQPSDKWIFDTPAYGSADWTCPSWAAVPETAIAVPLAVLEAAAKNSGLAITTYYPGQWKEHPGFFFQDVVVFTKL